jgi:hypothetical protein
MMALANQEIGSLYVLIDIDDPLTFDEQFIKYLEHGGFAKRWPPFTQDNRAAAASTDNPIIKNKFIIEVYVDRFIDFIHKCMNDKQYCRALIFCTVAMESESSMRVMYELKTVGDGSTEASIEIAYPRELSSALH